MKYFLILLVLIICSCGEYTSVHKDMTRQEVIQAYKECKDAGLIPLTYQNMYGRVFVVNCYSKEEYELYYKKCKCEK